MVKYKKKVDLKIREIVIIQFQKRNKKQVIYRIFDAMITDS